MYVEEMVGLFPSRTMDTFISISFSAFVSAEFISQATDRFRPNHPEWYFSFVEFYRSC